MYRREDLAKRLNSIESGFQKRRLMEYVWVVFLTAAIPLIFQLYSAYADTEKALSEAQIKIKSDQERLIETELTFSELREDLIDLTEELVAADMRLGDTDVRLSAMDAYEEQIQVLTSRLADARREIAAAHPPMASLGTVRIDEILRRSLDQRTVYVGDQAEVRSDIPISFNCAQLGGPSDIREAVEANAPTGLQLVRLDRVAAIPGGKCGHTYYSATFHLSTL